MFPAGMTSRMKSPPLVLFDAAGTLIEPARPVARVYAGVFRKHGAAVREEDVRLAFRRVFESLPDPDYAGHADGDAAERVWWRSVVMETARHSGARFGNGAGEACFGELFAHYAEPEAWMVFPEAFEVLAELKNRGCRMAIVSNFDRRLHRLVSGLGLADFFELVLTSADVAVRKPSPRLLIEAMRRSGMSAEQTCLVGDSLRADGAAAGAAGISSFILDRPSRCLRSFLEWKKMNFFPK